MSTRSVLFCIVIACIALTVALAAPVIQYADFDLTTQTYEWTPVITKNGPCTYNSTACTAASAIFGTAEDPNLNFIRCFDDVQEQEIEFSNCTFPDEQQLPECSLPEQNCNFTYVYVDEANQVYQTQAEAEAAVCDKTTCANGTIVENTMNIACYNGTVVSTDDQYCENLTPLAPVTCATKDTPCETTPQVFTGEWMYATDDDVVYTAAAFAALTDDQLCDFTLCTAEDEISEIVAKNFTVVCYNSTRLEFLDDKECDIQTILPQVDATCSFSGASCDVGQMCYNNSTLVSCDAVVNNSTALCIANTECVPGTPFDTVEYDVVCASALTGTIFTNWTGVVSTCNQTAMTELKERLVCDAVCPTPPDYQWWFSDADGVMITPTVNLTAECDYTTCSSTLPQPEIIYTQVICFDVVNNQTATDISLCNIENKPNVPQCDVCKTEWVCAKNNATAEETVVFSVEACANSEYVTCDITKCTTEPRSIVKQCVYVGTENSADVCPDFFFPEDTEDVATFCQCPTMKCALDNTFDINMNFVSCNSTCTELAINNLELFTGCVNSTTPVVNVYQFCVAANNTQVDTEYCVQPQNATEQCDLLCQQRCAFDDEEESDDFTAEKCINPTCTGLIFDENCDDSIELQQYCYSAQAIDNQTGIITWTLASADPFTPCGTQTLPTELKCDAPCNVDVEFKVVDYTVDPEESATIFYNHVSLPSIKYSYTGPEQDDEEQMIMNLTLKSTINPNITIPLTIISQDESFINFTMPYDKITGYNGTFTPGNFIIEMKIVSGDNEEFIFFPKNNITFAVGTYCQYQNTLPAEEFCSGVEGALCPSQQQQCISCTNFPTFVTPSTRDCTCPELLPQNATDFTECIPETKCEDIGQCVNGFLKSCDIELEEFECECFNQFTDATCSTCSLTCNNGKPNEACTKCICPAGTSGASCQFTETIAVGLVFAQVPESFELIKDQWEADLIIALANILQIDSTLITSSALSNNNNTNTNDDENTAALFKFNTLATVIADDGSLRVNLNIAIDPTNPTLTKDELKQKWTDNVTVEALNQYPVVQQAGGAKNVLAVCDGIECTDNDFSPSEEDNGEKGGSDEGYNVAVIIIVVILAALAILAIISVICCVSSKSASSSTSSKDDLHDDGLELS